MKSVSTFWSQLEADIDKYSNRAKKNIKEYQKLQYQNASRIKNRKKNSGNITPKTQSPSVENKLAFSINQIRGKYHQEKNKETKIKNKIHYLSVQRDRKAQSSDQVREKYHKVISIRSESLREKKFINQQLNSFKNNYYIQKKSMVLQVKDEKQSVEKSKKKLFDQKFNTAKSVRLVSKANQTIIEQQKSVQLGKKKQAVKTVQIAEKKSAEMLKKLTYRKIQIGKRHHQKKVWDQYKKLQLQIKKNNCLVSNFTSRVSKIETQKAKAQEDLDIYRSFLGLSRKNTQRSSSAVSRKNQNKVRTGSNSFYITGT